MICRHRLELMRYIYNGGGSDNGDSFDKDEAWSNCMETDQSGLGPRPLRWVDQTLPDTMCVVPALPQHVARLMPLIIFSQNTHDFFYLHCFDLFALNNACAFL